MTENVNAEAARLCREAAQIIEERGHHQGYFEAVDGSVCMWGALHIAQNGQTAHWFAGDIEYGTPEFEAAERVHLAVKEFFARKLREPLPNPLVGFPGSSSFNDLPGTTSKDVQKFLLSAADEIEFQS